jgi:hypothetical protein
MTRTTDTARAIKRLEQRIEALEHELQIFACGHIMLVDLLINTAISKGYAEELESALESLRGWYAHGTQIAFVENQFQQIPGYNRGIDMIEVFLARLRETRGDID